LINYKIIEKEEKVGKIKKIESMFRIQFKIILTIYELYKQHDLVIIQLK